jgi:hypothetical protein
MKKKPDNLFNLMETDLPQGFYSMLLDDGASSQPATRWLENDRDMIMLETFAYVDEWGYVWAVEKGFITDGKSTPRKLWGWYLVGSPYTGPSRRPAIPHDKYCRLAGLNKAMRKLADGMYKSGSKWAAKMNEDLGFLKKHWAAAVQYAGVRVGSWFKRKTKTDKID